MLEVSALLKRRTVEEAQGRIVAVVRRLEEAEALTVGRPDDDEDELL